MSVSDLPSRRRIDKIHVARNEGLERSVRFALGKLAQQLRVTGTHIYLFMAGKTKRRQIIFAGARHEPAF